MHLCICAPVLFQLMSRSAAKVNGWWTGRVRLVNPNVLPAVLNLLAEYESYVCYEEKAGTDNHHVHVMFSVVCDAKTKRSLDDRWRRQLEKVECRGNADRSLKQAEWSFDTALGYTIKDGNAVKVKGLFTDEVLEKARCVFADHLESKKRKENKEGAEKSLKFRVLKRCRDEDVKVHMKSVIGAIIVEEVIESKLVYSMRMMQDMAMWTKMQLMEKGESYERSELIEQVVRFL